MQIASTYLIIVYLEKGTPSEPLMHHSGMVW